MAREIGRLGEDGYAGQFSSVLSGNAGKLDGDQRNKIVPPAAVDANAGSAGRAASLKDALDELSQSDLMDNEAIDGFVEYFKSLYAQGDDGSRFRHMYSDVCETVYSHFDNEAAFSGRDPDEVVYIEGNIKRIVDRFRSKYPDSGELKCVVKLQDHISLEAVRIRKQVEWDESYYRRLVTLREQINEAQGNLDKSLNKAKKRMGKMEKDMSESRREYISILAIFAAVVLVFNGAVSLSSSSIGATVGYHPFAMGFVALAAGLALFNCLFALFTFLRTIVRADGEPVWKWSSWAAFIIIDIVLIAVFLLMFSVIKDAYWL